MCHGRGPHWPDDQASSYEIGRRQWDKARELYESAQVGITIAVMRGIMSTPTSLGSGTLHPLDQGPMYFHGPILTVYRRSWLAQLTLVTCSSTCHPSQSPPAPGGPQAQAPPAPLPWGGHLRQGQQMGRDSLTSHVSATACAVMLVSKALPWC
jgi:hypothetical protein